MSSARLLWRQQQGLQRLPPHLQIKAAKAAAGARDCLKLHVGMLQAAAELNQAQSGRWCVAVRFS